MAPPVRILLVEDEPLWQEGIRALLSSEAELDLVAVAEDYETALRHFGNEQPDLVLLDWNIRGDRDGLRVAQSLEENGFPTHRIILVSGSDPSVIPTHAYHFVPKQRVASTLLETIHSVTKN